MSNWFDGGDVVEGKYLKASEISGYPYGTLFEKCVIEADIPAIPGYRYMNNVLFTDNESGLLLEISEGRDDYIFKGNCGFPGGRPDADFWSNNEDYHQRTVWQNVMGE